MAFRVSTLRPARQKFFHHACRFAILVCCALIPDPRFNGVAKAMLGHLPYTLLGQLERSEEHTSELQSLMRISYAVFCLKKTQTYSYYLSTLCTYQNHQHYLTINNDHSA